METICVSALADAVKLCPPYMLENPTQVCTADDNFEINGQEIIMPHGIRVDYNDWKIIFHGYGIVEISKGDNAPATYGVNDTLWRGRENILFLMMAHYERKQQLHEALAKYKAKRDEIWDAARVLFTEGAIDEAELQNIHGKYNLRWALNQAKAEIGMEV